MLELCTRWRPKNPEGGRAKNCLSTQQNSWTSDDCSNAQDFICQFDPSEMKTSRNMTLELGSIDFFKIELWLQRKISPLPKPCNTSKQMAGFSITWRTTQGNRTGENQMFSVKQVLEKMYDNKNKPIIKIISTYQNYAKNVRYRIVRSARRYNMTKFGTL